MVVKKKKKQFLVRVIIFVAHEECGIFCGGGLSIFSMRDPPRATLILGLSKDTW